jgi:hypothetical protein
MLGPTQLNKMGIRYRPVEFGCRRGYLATWDASFLVHIIMIQGLEMIVFLHVHYPAVPHARETRHACHRQSGT